jgi:predicted outer membrane protein
MLFASALTVASAMILVGPVGAAQAQASAQATNLAGRAAAPASSVTLQTEEGELTEADRNLVLNVRLAGLWEIPAGQMAMTKGVSPRVRQIGQMISSQHVRLDALDKAAAKEIGMELPDRPTAQQSRWLDEMKAAKGAAFDDIYVMRLRAAHGKIFPVIAVVRATTKSDVIRNLAQSSNNFVLTHISLLESTGLVRYEELPKPKKEDAPHTVPATAGKRSQSSGLATPVIWIILATALIAGAVVTTRLIRPEIFSGRRNEPVHRGMEYPISPRTTTHSADFYPPEGLRLGSGSRSRS